MFDRIIRDTVDRCQTDTTFWHINDSFDADIIESVFNRAKISKDILDLFALIEVDCSDDTVRNVMHHKFFFKDTGLCIGTVKDRKIFIRSHPFFYDSMDRIRNTAGFFVFILKLGIIDQITFWMFGPKCFVFTDTVVADHCIGSIKDILCGTVIFF